MKSLSFFPLLILFLFCGSIIFTQQLEPAKAGIKTTSEMQQGKDKPTAKGRAGKGVEINKARLGYLIGKLKNSSDSEKKAIIEKVIRILNEIYWFTNNIGSLERWLSETEGLDRLEEDVRKVIKSFYCHGAEIIYPDLKGVCRKYSDLVYRLLTDSSRHFLDVLAVILEQARMKDGEKGFDKILSTLTNNIREYDRKVENTKIKIEEDILTLALKDCAEKCINPLEELLVQEPNEDTKLLCIRTLVNLNAKRSTDVIAPFVDKGSSSVRSEAIAALTKLNAKNKLDLILKHLYDGNPVIQMRVLSALAKFKAVKKYPLVLKLIDNNPPFHSVLDVIEFLFRVGKPELLEFDKLKKLMDNKMEVVVDRFIQFLALTGKTDKIFIDYIENKLNTTEAARLRFSALLALAYLGVQDDIPKIIDVLEAPLGEPSEVGYYKESAVRALWYLGLGNFSDKIAGIVENMKKNSSSLSEIEKEIMCKLDLTYFYHTGKSIIGSDNSAGCFYSSFASLCQDSKTEKSKTKNLLNRLDVPKFLNPIKYHLGMKHPQIEADPFHLRDNFFGIEPYTPFLYYILNRVQHPADYDKLESTKLTQFVYKPNFNSIIKQIEKELNIKFILSIELSDEFKLKPTYFIFNKGATYRDLFLRLSEYFRIAYIFKKRGDKLDIEILDFKEAKEKWQKLLSIY